MEIPPANLVLANANQTNQDEYFAGIMGQEGTIHLVVNQ